MFNHKKVSLIFPAYNEAQNITRAIRDFSTLGVIDEIIVVDNNSSDKTAQLAKAQKAKVVTEKKQGYGFALQKGLATAKGDYIILSEPDSTFLAADTLRLLKKIPSFDCVIGTRTNSDYIEPGANMKGVLRLGNIVLAKFIQVLYSTPSISDCGCTFRVLRKSVVTAVLPELKVGGSHFLSELLVIIAAKKYTLIEVPVHYRRRVGVSKITGSLRRSVQVGYNMMSLVLVYRFAHRD